MCFTGIQEPTFLFLELITQKSTQELLDQGFNFDQFILNEETKAKYQLIATLNHPTNSHFNCSIFEPCLRMNLKKLKGWYLHDGILNSGRLREVKDVNELWKQRPLLFFFKKINSGKI